jgi:hypothetical protein
MVAGKASCVESNRRARGCAAATEESRRGGIRRCCSGGHLAKEEKRRREGASAEATKVREKPAMQRGTSPPCKYRV